MNFDNLIDRCIAKMGERNMTNRDLAHLSGLSEATVSRALSGKGQNATVATIDAICTALDVTVAEPTAHSDLEQVYIARINDLKQTMAYQRRWLRLSFLAIAILVAFVLTILAIDLANPSVGWFRSALGLMYKTVGKLI